MGARALKAAIFAGIASRQDPQYFCCIDSRNWFRFAMRCCTSASCPWLMLRNSGPQTGMSLLPCAGVSASPRSTLETCIEGNSPLLLAANLVRSDGGTFNADAAGPVPLPSVPWQTAH